MVEAGEIFECGGSREQLVKTEVVIIFRIRRLKRTDNQIYVIF